MSLDDLGTLVFILIFVIIPLISRLGSRRRSQPTGRPAQPRVPQAQPPDQEAAPTGGAEEDAFARRLEEARRRVREALGETSGGTMGPSTGPVAQPPPPPLLPTTAPSTPPPFLIPPREAREHPDREPTAPARDPFRRRRQPEAAWASKTPPAARGRLSFDQDSILQGVIWHQILNPPISGRMSRRLRSRLRSR